MPQFDRNTTRTSVTEAAQRLEDYSGKRVYITTKVGLGVLSLAARLLISIPYKE